MSGFICSTSANQLTQSLGGRLERRGLIAGGELGGGMGSRICYRYVLRAKNIDTGLRYVGEFMMYMTNGFAFIYSFPSPQTSQAA